MLLRLFGLIVLFGIGRGAEPGHWQAYALLAALALIYVRDIVDGVRDLWRSACAAWNWIETQYYSYRPQGRWPVATGEG